MCVPVVAAAAIAGTALSAYGQISAGNYANAVARYNARNLDLAAADAERRGDLASQQSIRQTKAALGTQTTRLAAGNVSTASGSPLAILASTAGIGELDAQTIRNNAAREAWGYRAEAASQLAQGRFAQRSGWLGAGATLLTGAAQTYGLLRAKK